MSPVLGALGSALRWIGVALVGIGAPTLALDSLEAKRERRTTIERPPLTRPVAREARTIGARAIPTNLVEILRGEPFGADCPIVEDAYWPFEARRCAYFIADRAYDVTTATPPPDRVAAWIADASAMIPSLARLESSDHDAWEKGLAIVARYTMNQSARSFPLDGVVFEDFEGATEYEFRGGVTFGVTNEKTRSCGDCACRPNSLHRAEWCTYVADGLAEHDDVESYASCVAALGGERGWSDAWASTCLQLHADAWSSPRSESYRALLHFVEKNQIHPSLRDDAAPAEVLRALEDAFTYPHRRARPSAP
ncbi:MAG: hypothetical protein U0414_29860 [Polyangiaceae bacterium]